MILNTKDTRGTKVFIGSNGICDLPSPPGRKPFNTFRAGSLGYRAAPDKSDF
jgi:hypothetical protein